MMTAEDQERKDAMRMEIRSWVRASGKALPKAIRTWISRCLERAWTIDEMIWLRDQIKAVIDEKNEAVAAKEEGKRRKRGENLVGVRNF
jgi:hypothetical protein